MKYDHKAIEKKWQDRWRDAKAFKADDISSKEKRYVLDMFPYPSGAGLHVGHVEGYTATDIYSRFMRMKGFNVLHPMGWDAFGLPAENYAIKTKVHPKITTEEAIKTFRTQMDSLGLSYDWSREIGSHRPEYYKWTQWFFLLLYKNGLAYKQKAKVNWCPKDQTVLANEQVVDGKCERCGAEVLQKDLEQWFFKITKYAEELLADLDTIDWPESTKAAQRNWIGKSQGAEIDFPLAGKYRFVLLHGFSGSPENNFIPWLARELESHGHEVVTPMLPNATAPSENDQVRHVLESVGLTENTVLVGHSLGAVVALKAIEKYQGTIAGLVTAGGFIDPNFADHKRSFETTFTWTFDAKKIKNSVGFIRILQASNDSAVSDAQGQRLSDFLQSPLERVTANDDHFTGASEPTILSAAVPSIRVFTTRPDTLFGATYMVLAPEHPLVFTLKSRLANAAEVDAYVAATLKRTELERTSDTKNKTGVELKGIKAINPATKEEIPIFLADYVISHYGTGAIMAVPAHDERDAEFAKLFSIPTKEVVLPSVVDASNPPQEGKENTERNIILAIVRNPKNDTYLTLKWKEQPWTTFVTGGIEEGEDPIESARREIEEETGYTDIKLVRSLGQTESQFYAAHKGVNRKVRVHSVLFELVSEKQVPVAKKEAAQYNIAWLTEDEVVKAKLQHAEFEILWKRVRSGIDVYTGDGTLINSGEFSGMNSETAKEKITLSVGGRMKTTYKLRDWLISRQRYWGSPIPMIYCEDCGEVPVPEEELPVELPDDVDFMPTGESPLARSKSFQSVTCPTCKRPARRESDTMDTFVCSSWYYFRFADPKNLKEFASKEALKKWLPVDLYVGGAEHTVLHLLYSRFFTKVLRDLGYIDFKEPFTKLRHQGLILASDGVKMSKSLGNVVNPDEVVEQFGADSIRMYEMFMGPLDVAKPWNTNNIQGVRRFLEKVSALEGKLSNIPISGETEVALNQTIEKVGSTIENLRFNTAISQMMIYTNHLADLTHVPRSAYETLLVILSPFAPHVTHELWEKIGNSELLCMHSWPVFDSAKTVVETVEIGVQVNGKVRGTVTLRRDASEGEALSAGRGEPSVAKWLAQGKELKAVYVPGRIINFVTSGG